MIKIPLLFARVMPHLPTKIYSINLNNKLTFVTILILKPTSEMPEQAQ